MATRTTLRNNINKLKMIVISETGSPNKKGFKRTKPLYKMNFVQALHRIGFNNYALAKAAGMSIADFKAITGISIQEAKENKSLQLKRSKLNMALSTLVNRVIRHNGKAGYVLGY